MESQSNLWESQGATPSLFAPAGPQLRGYSATAARVASLAIVLFVLTLFVLAIPARQAELLKTFRNLSLAQELVLRELGVSGVQHAERILFVEVAVPALFLAVALLILWRKPDDWVAMLVSGCMDRRR